MADFHIALECTLKNEDSTLAGTVTFDTGGCTRFGVSEKAHPEVFPEMEECSRDRALEIAAQVYRAYWQYDGVQSQLVGNKIFDLAVNVGTHQAVKFAQQVCGTQIDGIWGPKTEQAVNLMDPLLMLNGLKTAAENFYLELAHSDPEKYNQYLAGWERRAEA